MSNQWGLGTLLSKSHELALQHQCRDGAGEVADVAGSIDELEKIAESANNAIVGISKGLIGIGSLLSNHDKSWEGIDQAASDIGWLLCDLGSAIEWINELKNDAAYGLELKRLQASGAKRAMQP